MILNNKLVYDTVNHSQKLLYNKFSGKATVRPSRRDTQAEIGDCQARESHPRPRGHRESGNGAPRARASRAHPARAHAHAARALAQQPRRRYGTR